MSTWIHHLVACSLPELGLQRSVLVTRGAAYETENYRELVLKALPASEARALLADLTILSLLGRVVPLRFFAGASHDYLRTLLFPPRGTSEEDKVHRAMQKARAQMNQKSTFARGTTPVQELFRGADALGADGVHPDDLSEIPFARLAEFVFGPLYAAEIDAAQNDAAKNDAARNEESRA